MLAPTKRTVGQLACFIVPHLRAGDKGFEVRVERLRRLLKLYGSSGARAHGAAAEASQPRGQGVLPYQLQVSAARAFHLPTGSVQLVVQNTLVDEDVYAGAGAL